MRKYGIQTVLQQKVPEGATEGMGFFLPSHFNVLWQNEGSQEQSDNSENSITWGWIWFSSFL